MVCVFFFGGSQKCGDNGAFPKSKVFICYLTKVLSSPPANLTVPQILQKAKSAGERTGPWKNTRQFWRLYYSSCIDVDTIWPEVKVTGRLKYPRPGSCKPASARIRLVRCWHSRQHCTENKNEKPKVKDKNMNHNSICASLTDHRNTVSLKTLWSL